MLDVLLPLLVWYPAIVVVDFFSTCPSPFQGSPLVVAECQCGIGVLSGCESVFGEVVWPL
jgi:hypothetical protein